MDPKEWEKCLHIPCHTPEFFSQVFISLNQTDNKEGLAKIFDLKQESLLSFLCDSAGLQDSFSLRGERRARLAAEYLVNEQGEIDTDRLDSLLSALKHQGYILYPNGLSDGVLTNHMLTLATKFRDDPNLRLFLKKFQIPLCHRAAEEKVRASLGLFNDEVLTTTHVRTAVLSACFSYLRQSVGSCFATAPAILIQSEQPKNLLFDLHEGLMTGKLIKTFAGVEYSVPLSPTSGAGDLHRTIDFGNKNIQIAQSPGLVAAFEAAGLLLQEWSLQEKINQLNQLIATCTNKMSVEDLLHTTLLHHFSLEEEDLASYEKMESALVKSQGFGGSLSGHLPTKKIQAVPKFLAKEKKAYAAFKAIVDHPLLKTWEFTLASFSEGKTDFSQWNLYFSLGFHPEEPGGIGEVIYTALQNQFETNQQKMHEYQAEYEVAFDALRATESLLKRASTESEIRRLKVEFNSRLHHMQTCLDIRDKGHREASNLSSLLPALIKEYSLKFQEYFQEIYDADMTDIKIGLYEDSPAGFRLVYKHGRSNASLWTLIYNAKEYSAALAEFFLSVEPAIADKCSPDETNKLISDITSALIFHVRSESFIETAFMRIAKAHKESLAQDLEKAKKKPWAYTSGGSMMTLLQTYYKKETPLTKEAFWVENETNLLVFILNALKAMPMSVQEASISHNKGILISSPTHAFILYPGFELVQEGWQEDLFTYSWVRDKVINPGKAFYTSKTLSSAMQSFLIEELEKQVPPTLAIRLRESISSDGIPIQVFRDSLTKTLPAELIDSFLYGMLPLTPGTEWKSALYTLLQELDHARLTELLDSFPDTPCLMMSAKTLKNLAKAFYMLVKDSYYFSFDLHRHIEKKAAKHGYAPPSAVIFADTNWTSHYFGFIVNPGTNALELWRLDYTGSTGSKMSIWQRFLDGTDHSL
ncbi:MAG: hypothetical protein V4489_08525, partial [Chlamydiota bacterium]